jgi:hypothetical protein
VSYKIYRLTVRLLLSEWLPILQIKYVDFKLNIYLGLGLRPVQENPPVQTKRDAAQSGDEAKVVSSDVCRNIFETLLQTEAVK